MLIPSGGERLWGQKVMGLPMVHLRKRNLTMKESYDLLASAHLMPEDLKRIAPWLLDGVRLSRPVKVDSSSFSSEPPEHTWANVLAAPLPFAPRLRKYAFYGIGVATEFSGALDRTGDDVDSPMYSIATNATENHGFHLGDGDYSCPVLSLGIMCVKGWLDAERNPARTPCTVKEYKDKPSSRSLGSFRGGPASGDHIDILGNDELIEDVLTVAVGGHVEQRIMSNIHSIAERWDDT